MLSETLTASLLLTCMACFFIVNIRNILTTRRISEKTTKPHAEIEMPSGFVVNLAAFATFMYFIEAFAYVILTLTDRIFWTDLISIRSFGQLVVVTQIMGAALTTSGYFIFIWSVVARGRYATSWEMRDDHRLVTWGHTSVSGIHHTSAIFLCFLVYSLSGRAS